MFRRAGCYCWMRSCALAFAFLVGSVCAQTSTAQDMLVNGGAVAAPYAPMSYEANPYEAAVGQPSVQAGPGGEPWIAPPGTNQPLFGPAPYNADPTWGQP